MAHALSADAIRGAHQVVDALRKDPSLVHTSELGFFKTYLASLHAQLPPEPAAPKKAKGGAHHDAEDFSDLNDDGVVPADHDPPQPMGPPGEVELSELDHDRLVDLKSAAGALASEGRHADAVESFTRAIKLSPSALLYAKRADCYLKLKKPNAAIRDCDAALALNPDSAKAFKARGIAHRMLGHWEQAAADLGTGLRIDFDEEAAAVQKVASEKALAIKRRRAEAEAAKEEAERQRRAAAAAAAKASASASAPSGGFPGGGFPGGMPGGFPGMGGMPGGMPGMGGGMPGVPPELLNAVMQDPELMSAMMNPKIQAALQECMGNPSAILKYKSDPAISRVIDKIVNLGLGAGMAPGAGMGGMGGMGGGMGGMGGGFGGAAPHSGGGVRVEEINEEDERPRASSHASAGVNDVD